MVSAGWMACNYPETYVDMVYTVMLSYAHFYRVPVCVVVFFLIVTHSLYVYLHWRKTHHIKDDQNTMGKHIRKAGKCERADSLLLSHSTVCISLSHHTLSVTVFLSSRFSLVLLFHVCIYVTYQCCHNILQELKECPHVICMSDRQHIFSRGPYLEAGSFFSRQKPGVSLSVLVQQTGFIQILYNESTKRD